jgi:hypothetical protein
MGIRTAAVFLLSLSLFAQGYPAGPSKAHVDAIKKLSFVLGEWKGEAWAEMVPGQKKTMTQTETVELKLHGTAVLIHGRGTDGNTVGHDALAIITWDQPSGTYKFRSYVFQGYSHESDLTVGDKSFAWTLRAGPATMRYNMRITPEGLWNEVGEISTDGQNWRKFVELNLKRVK